MQVTTYWTYWDKFQIDVIYIHFIVPPMLYVWYISYKHSNLPDTLIPLLFIFFVLYNSYINERFAHAYTCLYDSMEYDIFTTRLFLWNLDRYMPCL